jgi:glycosyltransferase involved in cell wall biosynthesis
MPKVSICIPAYKQVDYLREALLSIQEQTFTDFEIVLTDDSPDNAVYDLLKEFDFKGKLNYHKNSPALGSPANWNYGLNVAKGEYIKILHHDDFFATSDSLQKFVDLLDKNPQSDFAFSGSLIDLLMLKTEGRNLCTDAQLKKIIAQPESLFYANKIGAPSATIIRNGNEILFDEDMKWLVDIDWYISLIQQNKNVVHTKEYLIVTTHGAEGQVTQAVQSDKKIQIKEHLLLLNKVYSASVNQSKLSLYFQILFSKYSINTLEEAQQFATIDAKVLPFIQQVLQEKDKNIFLKKVRYWVGKSKPSDYWLMLKSKMK